MSVSETAIKVSKFLSQKLLFTGASENACTGASYVRNINCPYGNCLPMRVIYASKLLNLLRQYLFTKRKKIVHLKDLHKIYFK